MGDDEVLLVIADLDVIANAGTSAHILRSTFLFIHPDPAHTGKAEVISPLVPNKANGKSLIPSLQLHLSGLPMTSAGSHEEPELQTGSRRRRRIDRCFDHIYPIILKNGPSKLHHACSGGICFCSWCHHENRTPTPPATLLQ